MLDEKPSGKIQRARCTSRSEVAFLTEPSGAAGRLGLSYFGAFVFGSFVGFLQVPAKLIPHRGQELVGWNRHQQRNRGRGRFMPAVSVGQALWSHGTPSL